MPEQPDWRYCQDCHVLFYNGFAAKGRCPGGGTHTAQGLNFNLPYGAGNTATAQANWRYCEKCHAMFYDGYGHKGACSVAGGHTAQGINFALPHSVASTPAAQGNWRHCEKCHAMFYDGYTDKGRCPAGGGHVAQGLSFTLPHKGALEGATAAGDIMWKGVPLSLLATFALHEFGAGFREGARQQIPDDMILQLEAKIMSDPNGFKLGYARGCLSGLLTGLKGLFEAVVALAELAAELSFPAIAFKTSREAFLMLTDHAHRQLREKQLEQTARLARLLKDTAVDINENPGDYIAVSRDVGSALGESAGMWLTDETVKKSPHDFGEVVGSVVGQVAFEIVLQIIIELGTAGLGNVARAAAAVGRGTKSGAQLTALARRLAAVLERAKGLQKLFAALFKEERALASVAATAAHVPELAAGFEARHMPALRRLFGKAFSHADIQDVGRLWSAAANPGEAATLTLENSRRLFDNHRTRFWRQVRRPENAAVRRMFEDAGFVFDAASDTSGPTRRLADGSMMELTIDHIVERQTAPGRALDPANLRISTRRENTVMLRQITERDPFQAHP